jgi:GTPase SAR1 family protein
VIIGETRAGKTSLLTRYAEDYFRDNMIPTLGDFVSWLRVGVDYRTKKVDLGTSSITLQIWDTAG